MAKKKKKADFSLEKEKGLHGWFSRNNGKGWVNCKTGGSCGRKKAGKGSYPACQGCTRQEVRKESILGMKSKFKCNCGTTTRLTGKDAQPKACPKATTKTTKKGK
jgi:hypothetical protein